MRFLNRLATISCCCVLGLNSIVFADDIDTQIPNIPLEIVYSVEEDEQTQTLDIDGYSVELPSTWKIELNSENSEAKFFSVEDGMKIGAAKLIYKPIEDSDGDTDTAFIKIVEQMAQEDINKYNAARLEYLGFLEVNNTPPYGYVIYFNRDFVNESQIAKINDSFKSPLEVRNAPDKNIQAMSYEEMQQNATYFIRKDNTSVGYNVEKLDKFIENQENGFPDSLNIFKLYEDENGDKLIKEWNYITYDGEKAYQYSYYQNDYDSFTYDNIPKEFDYIVRKDYGDTIDYRIFDGEIGNSLLQINEFAD